MARIKQQSSVDKQLIFSWLISFEWVLVKTK
jgi:hypothetical protein